MNFAFINDHHQDAKTLGEAYEYRSQKSEVFWKALREFQQADEMVKKLRAEFEQMHKVKA